MTFSICAAVIVKNEERCISRCIESILHKFDEYLFVDSGSSDNTNIIINDKFSSSPFKFKLFNVEWEDSFSKLRNVAINNCTSDAIFFIDADEVLLSSKIDIIKNFRFILESKNKHKITLCPIINNHDNHKLKSIPRGFFLKHGFYYFGFVHEDIRNTRVSNIVKFFSSIIIQHDGYKNEIQESKKKQDRNKKLNLLNISIEPNNLRWIFFYCRDLMGMVSYNEIYFTMSHLIDIDKVILDGYGKKKKSVYSFLILDLISTLKLADFSYENYSEILEAMDEIHPNNGNTFYYKKMREILKWKSHINNILLQAIDYINENNNHSFSMHSDGYHIDQLLAICMYENGYIEHAGKIFLSLKNNDFQTSIMNKYMKLLSKHGI